MCLQMLCLLDKIVIIFITALITTVLIAAVIIIAIIWYFKQKIKFASKDNESTQEVCELLKTLYSQKCKSEDTDLSTADIAQSQVANSSQSDDTVSEK